MTLDIFSGIIKLTSPLSHLGNEKTGSVSLLNRQTWLVDDEPMQIPFISGNSVRGVLRRRCMTDMFRQIGYTIDLNDKMGKKLYHALFTGGILEQVGEKDKGTINLELKRKMLDELPFVKLFGLAWGNQMIESIMSVGQMLPICTELKDYLPGGLVKKTNPYRQLISDTFQTRRDDIRDTREKDEAVTQMMIDYETFVAGAKFYHEFRLEDATELDLSAFARLMELWRSNPVLGGKSKIGFGNCIIDYDLKDLSGEQYKKHLQKNKKSITELLDELQKP